MQAEAQARIVRFLAQLTDEEQEVLRRGRIKRADRSRTIPMRLPTVTVRLGKAFLGYLYLTGRSERMKELMAAGFNYLKTVGQERGEDPGGEEGGNKR